MTFILYILLTILILLCIIVLMRLNLLFSSNEKEWKLVLKFLFFKIDLSKIIKKTVKTNAKTKKTPQRYVESELIEKIKVEMKSDINTDIKSENVKTKQKEIIDNLETKKTKKEKVSPKKIKEDKFDFDLEKIDDYLEILGEILEILDQLAFCLTIKKVRADIFIKTEDDAKTGKIIGAFWVLYGNITAFLYKNFLIEEYKINVTPIWEEEDFEIIVNSQIIVHTSIFRVLKNIKYKKIIEIRKRVLK